jgi:hypothetical protein
MKPETANHVLHKYELIEALKISPDLFEDQIVHFPSFKKVVKWILGKKLSITVRKGLDAVDVDNWLAILDTKRFEQNQQLKEQESKIRSQFK